MYHLVVKKLLVALVREVSVKLEAEWIVKKEDRNTPLCEKEEI